MKSRVATDIKPRVIIVGQRLLSCRKHEVRALFITRKLLMSANFRRGKSYVAPRGRVVFCANFLSCLQVYGFIAVFLSRG